MTVDSPIQDALEIRVRQSISAPGLQRVETAVIKNGPQAYKTVSLLHFGNSAEAITKKELVLQSWKRKATGSGYDFDAPVTFRCERDEVEKVRAFIQAELGEPGTYHVVSDSSPLIQALDMVGGRLTLEEASRIAALVVGHPSLVEILKDLPGLKHLRAAAELGQYEAALDRLEQLVDDPDTPEAALQALLEQHWWLLGGQDISQTPRRLFTAKDQVDLALLRSDGVVHVIELKRANIPRLVGPYRNRFSVGKDVNAAVNQVANYLRVFDEQAPVLAQDFGISFRRASGTIVIGHPAHVQDVKPEDVREAIRNYNSHLSRIDVMTYEDIIVGARAWMERLRSEATGEEPADFAPLDQSLGPAPEPTGVLPGDGPDGAPF